MKKTQILGVFGAGQMGQGITQTAASFGFSVHCLDSSLKMLEKTQAQIEKKPYSFSKQAKDHSGRKGSDHRKNSVCSFLWHI